MTTHQISLRNDAANIHYRQKGEGRVTLLFLHGWCIDSSYWEAQIAFFSKNYSVYAIDNAGFGQSTAKRDNWTIEAYADDVLAFINTLALGNVILIGHSMSGDIMLETVLKDSSKIIGLAGIDNYKFIDMPQSPEQINQFQQYMNALKEDFTKNAPNSAEHMLFHSSTPYEIKERVKSDIAGTPPAVGYNSFINYIQYQQSVSEKLEALPFKLYLLNSDGLPTFTVGLEQRCKHGFELHNVGTTGHYPMVEAPERFNEMLSNILEKIAQNNIKT